MTATVFDARICALGEGALWHPLRAELFWFDITGKRLLSRSASGERRDIALHEMCSAAAWIDQDQLLIASETSLSVFDIASGRGVRTLCALEPDNATTRSNDGRADPWGGFWIGTMGKSAEPGAGAIYRLFDGRLERLFSNLTIPNAICFAPDRSCAYYADTDRGQIFRVALDAHGWPAADADLFVDVSDLGYWPDGATMMADGTLAVALWGEGAVLCISPAGQIGGRVDLPAPHTTCPAFGGAEYRTLFCTSATQGLSAQALTDAPQSGATFAVETHMQGRPEPSFDLTRFGDKP